MSLVVGRVFGKSMMIVRDTLTTHVHGAKLGFLDWTIKSIILSPQLCVSFAGNNEYSRAALNAFVLDWRRWDQKTIVDHFLEFHTKAKEECEFLLAFGGLLQRFATISRGKVQFNSHGWIGSGPAFERFQKAFGEREAALPLHGEQQLLEVSTEPSNSETDNSLCRKMTNAMDVVIGDSAQNSVGGACIRVATSYAEESRSFSPFRYLDRTIWTTELLEISSCERLVDGLCFPSPQGEGYITRVLGAFGSGLHTPAIYFPQAEFGLLFMRQGSALLEPLRIEDSEKRDFAAIVEKRYGLKLPAWGARRLQMNINASRR